jgi:hypothetical protein
MVHALKEARRALRTGGTLIDMRPISVDVPILILTSSGWESAGRPSQSPDRVHDLVANRAIRDVVREGLLVKVKQVYFVTNYYWDDIKELQSDVEEYWKEDIIVTKEIWQKARRLFKRGSGQRRILAPMRRKLTAYRKIGA